MRPTTGSPGTARHDRNTRGRPPVTGAVLLAAYAAAAGFLAPAALRRGWSVRAPRLAMALWLALPVSWVAAVALAVLAATAPFLLSWPGPPPGGRPALLAGGAVPGRS